MPEAWPLRRRMVSAHVLLTLIVCAVFAATALHAIDAVEESLIDQRLAQTADQLQRRLQQGHSLDLPPSVTLYPGDALPAALQGLAEGRHELLLDGVSVNVLVRNGAATARPAFVLVDADADFESVKRELLAFLGLACAASLALAVAFGRATASQVIAPVTALAQAVAEDRLPDRFALLRAGDELGVLARAFAGRTRELQQLLLREQQFVADVSHELRTPLAVIMGAAEVLQDRGGSDSDVAVLAERMRRTAADTAARVSALLLLSRRPEALASSRIALADIVRLEMERCQPLLRGKDVALNFECRHDVQLQAPPELVGTAIGNLISNACRYTEHGAVNVRLESDRLLVQDTGVGVPPELQPRVFERHVHADAAHGGGSGLGLAIVRRVAQHLGWQVALQASSAAGSCFALHWGPQTGPADVADVKKL